MSIRDLERKPCPVKRYVGCATCYKRYDCEESYFFERLSNSELIIGSILLIAVFVVITLAVMG